MTFTLEPGPSGIGAWISAACVVAGAPLFAAGLRAWRLRRSLHGLAPQPLAATLRGLVCVRGRVELDEPLRSPLSGRPCAGWALDVRGAQTRVGAAIERRQDFRLIGGGIEARVAAECGRWQLPVTAEQRFAPNEALPEGTLAALGGQPELAWLRSIGVPLCVTERALFQGLEAHVVAIAHEESATVVVPLRGLRTGTDPHTWELEPAREAVLALQAREPLGTTLVCAGEPDLGELAPAAWRLLGLVLGPLLSLFGLLQLALAALGGPR